MGLNYLQFLIEAFRVMRKGGFLIIAEVISRMNTLEQFTTMVELIGFKLYTKVP
jgi:ribosomal RNA-processing protein 8